MQLLFSVIASKVMEVIMQVIAEVFEAIVNRLWECLPAMLVIGQVRDQNFDLMK